MAREQRHSSTRAWRWRSWLVELLVLAMLAFAVVAYRYDLGERWFGWGPVDPTAAPAEVLPPVGLRLPVRQAAPAVAEPSDAVPADLAAVSAALSPQLQAEVLGPHYAVLVTDLTTGEEVFRAGQPTVVPASTTKILTSVAALEVLGPEHRFDTTVRWEPEQRRLVLVGGGDPFLEASPRDARGLYPERADLTTLAGQAVTSLQAQGVDLTGISVGVDDTLFSGPRVNPTWQPGYLDDITSGISALWVDQAVDDDGFGFDPDPAMQAGRVFSQVLRQAGAGVPGRPQRAQAPASAAEVARVQSAPLAEIVERTLATSDNQAADVLAHQVGLAESGEGSFTAGAAATLDVVRRLGLPADGDRLLDGSGLSRQNLLSASTLAGAVRLAASTERPELRAVITGMPVAGFTGSLATRFDDGPAQALGRVRAKTGTLTSVHGLTGVVDSPDGARMAFVAIADQVAPDEELDARLQIDAIAGALGACRCGVGS